MKVVRVDGVDMTMLRLAGQGDAGGRVMYLTPSGIPGQYTETLVWWSDPAIADDAYDNPDMRYLRWAKADAEDRLLPVAQRVRPLQPLQAGRRKF